MFNAFNLYSWIRYNNTLEILKKKKKNPPLQLDHKSRYTELLKFSGYFYNTIKAVSIESTRFSIVPPAILSKIAIRIDREREGGEREKKKDESFAIPSSFQLRIYQRVYQRNKPPHSNVKYTLLVEIRANRDNVEIRWKMADQYPDLRRMETFVGVEKSSMGKNSR